MSTVQYIDHMGSDLTVVNAARVSFSKRKQELDPSDEKLIKYLADNQHWSPFAHAFLQVRVQTSIFVARQLVKHQVGLSWNEVSRRYVSDAPTFEPSLPLRNKPPAGASKQGSAGVHLRDERWRDAIRQHECASEWLYNDMIADGVAPEQARVVLPLSLHTEWIWSGSLMAFARVCKLRLHPHAQLETRVVVEPLAAICREHFPLSFKALTE